MELENLGSILMGIDPKVIWITAGIIAILGIISLVKKAIKLGIIILIVSLVVTYGGSYIDQFKEKYQFEFNSSGISVMVDGQKKEFSFDALNNMEVTPSSTNNVEVSIKDENGKTYKFEMNKKLYNALKEKMSKE